MALRIDLHTHSNASDGTSRPAEVMTRARTAGLDVVALTDHDTVAGHDAAAAALPAGLTLVPGAEISCVVRHADGTSTELHMLGYLFDPAEPEFARERELLRTDRVRRAEAMVARLQDLGVAVEWAQVLRIAEGGAIGRPHIARALIEAGAVATVADAFTDEWIGKGGRAFVEKHALDAFDAVRLIQGAGGVPVFAHPGAQLRGPIVSDDDIAALAEAGLFGLEVDHPDHDAATRDRLRRLAVDLGLEVTGASDDHGSITGHRLGCETTDPAVLDALLARAAGGRPVVAAGAGR